MKMSFFDHQNIFFFIWEYGVSYLEFFGLLSGIIAVALSAYANVWNWIVGIINIILSFLLFYQVQLYPDMLLMGFFFVTNILGFWRWTHPSAAEEDPRHELRISILTRKQLLAGCLAGIAGTLLLGAFAGNLHEILPKLFSLPSAYPYMDSFVTVMSIIGTYYAVQKKVEVWIVWLVVDMVATWLYFMRDIRLYSVLYCVYFFIAAFALYRWMREYRSYP
jgi:nicotinamide mononucleotide transporter